MIVTPEQVKIEACQTEINAVLAKHGLRFEPFCLIRPQGMTLGTNLIPIATLIPGPTGGGKADG